MPKRSPNDLPQTPIGDAVAELAQTLGIDLYAVRTVKRVREVMRQRARIVQELIGRGYRWIDVADVLHCNESTVSHDLRISLDDQPTPPTRKTP